MHELKKENEKYIMTMEKIKNGNAVEYWVELTNKTTLTTQTIISKNKKRVSFMNYDLNFIAQKFIDWDIEGQKVYKNI